MEKMTNRKALEFVLGLEVVVANEEVYQKLAKMLEQVEKKNSSTNKDGKRVLSPEQKKNEVIKERLLEVLAENQEPLQIKEMMTIEGLEFSNQKLSALIRQLVTEGKVERIEEKKVAKFKIA